ncbi:zinc-binding dehydrogenase [Yinghuangia sp. ASG 101]|uniref:zinc-binding dehydrogenase n=1 Tax=Yinghuangia sp. ASG 101 TaxID=2896848 RepID=UPI001E51F054|nr:zinc-binding dehydrogenase [Yinghuangia sp. ASG 101]UGQ14324.1 zinc-binding dehydrogenase [Yinghuangia sp. ASG 101]
MFAVSAVRISPDDPLSGLELGERPDPGVRSPLPPGWTTVTVKAASLNHHDLWTLKGVGITEKALPMVLGCDGAGIDEDGNEVVLHSVIGGLGTDEPRSILTEKYDGTFAEKVAVPRWNLLPKPKELSFEEAACLPTAWLTAYRMLFTNSGVRPGGTVLVQGAGGGVATALVALGKAAGFRMWVTSRDAAKGERAVELGADRAFASGERLPERVDAVMETVGEATWSHSLRSLRPGGTVVISGATSGSNPSSGELTRIFFQEMRVVGSTMGDRDELAGLLSLCATGGVRPAIDTVLPLDRAREGFARMADGELFGKVVFTV